MATTGATKRTSNRSTTKRVRHQDRDMSLIIMRLSMGLLGLGSLLQAAGHHTLGALFSAAGGACGVGSR